MKFVAINSFVALALLVFLQIHEETNAAAQPFFLDKIFGFSAPPPPPPPPPPPQAKENLSPKIDVTIIQDASDKTATTGAGNGLSKDVDFNSDINVPIDVITKPH